MIEYIYIGKIVNTHALKGEIKIISNFEYKEKIFKNGAPLYIGTSKHKEEIETYRKHKNFDMVKFKGIDYINDVLKYKGEKVYIDKNSLNLDSDEVLTDDLIGMKVIYNEKEIGAIEEYRCDNGNKLIRINNKYIPYNKAFIIKIDKKNKKIYYQNLEGLI